MTPFHLAIPVHDIEVARQFYGGLLGFPEGRSAERWVDFDMYGHQLVVHLDPDLKPRSVSNPVDGHQVPIPHFGVVLPMHQWQSLASKLEADHLSFLIQPYVRFAGEPGEQGTFFVRDPSGNALEFKGFDDVDVDLFGRTGMELPIIATDRLQITILRPRQAHLMLDYVTRNRHHLKNWEPTHRAQVYTLVWWQKRLAEAIRDYHRRLSVRFVGIDPHSGEIWASCNLTNICRGNVLSCQMGYSVDAAHQGKGIMFELAQVATKYAFEEFGLRRISASHLIHNDRSARLLARLGFEREGIAKRLIKINGKWEDHVLNSLIRNRAQP